MFSRSVSESTSRLETPPATPTFPLGPLVIYNARPNQPRVQLSTPFPPSVAPYSRQVYKLRNEKDVYRGQYPDRMTLLKNMGFEWEHSAVPQEWDLIITGKSERSRRRVAYRDRWGSVKSRYFPSQLTARDEGGREAENNYDCD